MRESVHKNVTMVQELWSAQEAGTLLILLTSRAQLELELERKTRHFLTEEKHKGFLPLFMFRPSASLLLRRSIHTSVVGRPLPLLARSRLGNASPSIIRRLPSPAGCVPRRRFTTEKPKDKIAQDQYGQEGKGFDVCCGRLTV